MSSLRRVGMFVRIRPLTIASALLLGASSAVAVSALPTTGTCAYLGSFHYPFMYLKEYPQAGFGSPFGLSILATFNFDTKAVSGNVVQINPCPSQCTQSQEQMSFSGTFTVSNGPVPNSYLLSTTLTLPALPAPITVTDFKWNAVPVNGGNTLLMQLGPMPNDSSDGGMAGVCQF
jgi:hypothetical protein